MKSTLNNSLRQLLLTIYARFNSSLKKYSALLYMVRKLRRNVYEDAEEEKPNEKPGKHKKEHIIRLLIYYQLSPTYESREGEKESLLTSTLS